MSEQQLHSARHAGAVEHLRRGVPLDRHIPWFRGGSRTAPSAGMERRRSRSAAGLVRRRQGAPQRISDDKLGLALDRIRGLADKAIRHRADMLVRPAERLPGCPRTSGAGSPTTARSFLDRARSANKLTAALSEAALDSAEQALGDLTTDDGTDPLG